MARGFRQIYNKIPSKVAVQDSSVFIEYIGNHYPIELHDNGIRRGSYENKVKALEWYDRTFLIPLRSKLAEFSMNMWVNKRFAHPEEEGGQGQPYLPSTFLKGAKFAIKQLFDAIPKDIALMNETEEDDVEKLAEKSLLKPLVSDQLLKLLCYQHRSFALTPYDLQIRLNSVSNFEKKDTWLCFGDKSIATSTLNKAPVHTEIDPLVFWRHDAEKDHFYFSELNFEYAIKSKDVKGADNLDQELDGPLLASRMEATKKGAVLGIDVAVDVDLTVAIKEKENYIEKDGESGESAAGTGFKWQTTIRRPMLFRFQTTHFHGQHYTGTWKIADIDNYFASKLF